MRSEGKEGLSTETEQRVWGDHVLWDEIQPHHRAGEHTHTRLYPSLVNSGLLTPQTLSLFGESIMKSIPHYFSNNVANKKKSYLDGVWFSAKRRVKTAILSAALWKCFSWSRQFTRGNTMTPTPFLILAPARGDRLCYLCTRTSVGRRQGQVKVTPCWLCHQNMAQLSPLVWYSETPVKIAPLWDSGRSGPWEVAPGPGLLVQAPLSEPPHLRFLSKKNVPASWWQRDCCSCPQ